MKIRFPLLLQAARKKVYKNETSSPIAMKISFNKLKHRSCTASNKYIYLYFTTHHCCSTRLKIKENTDTTKQPFIIYGYSLENNSDGIARSFCWRENFNKTEGGITAFGYNKVEGGIAWQKGHLVWNSV